MALSKTIYDWAAAKANSRFSHFWLGMVFVLELVLFIPFDAVLVLFCLENPSRRYVYATFAALASVFTGLVGFLIGHLAWDLVGPWVLDRFVSQSFFDNLCLHYQNYQNWAVFLGALLPMPLKAVTLSAGVCHLAITPFLLCIFLARMLRFFLVAKAVQIWGVQIKSFVTRHFGGILVIMGAKIALAFAFLWSMG